MGVAVMAKWLLTLFGSLQTPNTRPTTKRGGPLLCLRSALRSPALGLYSQCLCRKVALQIGVGAQRVELSLGQA